MGIFPEFGGWISQNTQQLKEFENVKSKPVRETKTHDERDETREQLKLWRDANKKKQYNEPSPTVKVHTDHNIDSSSSMEMEFTLGLPPQAAYDFLTNHDNKTYSREINGRPLLKAISRKVTSERGLGDRPILEVDKELSWNFLFFSGTIPIRLYVLEKPEELSVRNVSLSIYLIRIIVFDQVLENLIRVSPAYCWQAYNWKSRKGMDYMETFRVDYTVEPIYVDAERLCKHKKPKSIEEYRKCSGGKGLIASKIKVDQSFRLSFPWNLPLLSLYFRRFTVETTKKVAEDLQMRAGDIRGF